MSYKDFKFPEVCAQLGLTLRAGRLHDEIAPAQLSTEFRRRLSEDIEFTLPINTEKARSEFIVAPLLAELRRLTSRPFSLFSGVSWDVDEPRDLRGVCDFLISRSEQRYFIESPVIVVAEAKNDSTRDGLGQCIAATLAAKIFNERAGNAVSAIHGVSTTGTAWKFLRLVGDTVTLEPIERFIDDPGRILGILRHIVETA